MPIFKTTGSKLKKLSAINLDKEKNLQKLIEDNLMEVLDLRFLATEYTTTAGGRIDTLAVDASGAPVIIEYKRNKNDAVINQALSYLKWLKAQKPEFFQMLMIQKLGKNVAEALSLDWKNPRVICIAEAYNKFDLDTAEVIPLRIELYRYRYYEDALFSLEPVNVEEKLGESSPNQTAGKTDAPMPTIAALRGRGTLAIQQLFDTIDERVRLLDETIEVRPNTLYIAYRLSKNFTEVHIGKDKLTLYLRPIEYSDPKGMVNKIPDGYNWTMDRRVYLNTQDDLDYVMGLIEQSYEDVL